MQRLTVLILVLFLGVSAMAQNKISEKEKNEINTLLQKQVDAWNEGNLEEFMETYWKSDKLVFVGSRGPKYGWQVTLDNYKKGYPNREAMGKLAFKIMDISKIDKKTIFVVGRFELTRKIGDAAGHFTLVLQKIKGKWLIISDHSSAERKD